MKVKHRRKGEHQMKVKHRRKGEHQMKVKHKMKEEHKMKGENNILRIRNTFMKKCNEKADNPEKMGLLLFRVDLSFSTKFWISDTHNELSHEKLFAITRGLM